MEQLRWKHTRSETKKEKRQSPFKKRTGMNIPDITWDHGIEFGHTLAKAPFETAKKLIDKMTDTTARVSASVTALLS